MESSSKQKTMYENQILPALQHAILKKNLESFYHFRRIMHFNEVGTVSLSVIKIP